LPETLKMTANNADPVDSSTGPEELGFEDAFRQLAEIAERLEAGGLTLAEATSRYEDGMKLVQRCNHLLDSAELEITTLRENYQRPAATTVPRDTAEPPHYDDAPYDDAVEGEEELPF
jgi:exodeoxyribonuclease VII small subunit